MNVTLILPDELVREARHLALDENTSLSALVAGLLSSKLEEKAKPKEQRKSLAEAMVVPGMPDWFYEKEFLLEDRKNGHPASSPSFLTKNECDFARYRNRI